MFEKLRRKLLRFVMVSLSLVVLLAFSAIYLVTYHNMQQETNRQLQNLRNKPLAMQPPSAPDASVQPMPDSIESDYRVSFSILMTSDNIAYVDSLLDYDESVYQTAISEASQSDRGVITLEGRRWAYLVSRSAAADSAIHRIAFLDVTANYKTLSQLLLTLALTAVLVLAALYLIARRFAGRAITPIEDSYLRQQQFITDSSHEFRTPLAVIAANVDAIEASPADTVESQQEWFGYIRSELRRSSKLVDDLLYLSKSQMLPLEEGVAFDLSAACEHAAASVEALLYDREIHLMSQIEPDIVLVTDGDKVRQLIYIMLDNACRYTPSKGQILVHLLRVNDRVRLRISNTAEALSEEDRLHLFDRFYRPDRSRSSDSGGSGLGLSIAKTICDRLGASIVVENDPGMLSFVVSFRGK